jgi:hypothetical protein
VGRDGLTAVLRRGRVEHVESVSAPIDPAAPDLDATLAAAMTSLRSRLESGSEGATRHARVHIALLPPFAECRMLQLPPLRDAEAAAVVRRDAGRYFVNVPAPRATAVALPPRGTVAPVLAAAAPAQLLEAVHHAAVGMQWQVAGVVPAHGAWLTAGAGHKGVCAVIAVIGETTYVMLLQDGIPRSLRRLPTADTDGITAAAGGQVGAALFFTPPDLREQLRQRFAALGWSVVAGSRTGAEAAAAQASAGRPRLLAAAAEMQRRAQERRYAAWLGAAAVALLLGSAAVELWGAHRELDAVRGRRAEIRAQVGPLLAMRDSLHRLDTHSTAIENIARAAPHWTTAIFELSVLLPLETHLTRLHTTGDTIIVEAEGNRAGATLQALRSAASLRDARLLGGVERELSDGATAVERFRLSARLAGAASAITASANPDGRRPLAEGGGL